MYPSWTVFSILCTRHLRHLATLGTLASLGNSLRYVTGCILCTRHVISFASYVPVINSVASYVPVIDRWKKQKSEILVPNVTCWGKLVTRGYTRLASLEHVTKWLIRLKCFHDVTRSRDHHLFTFLSIQSHKEEITIYMPISAPKNVPNVTWSDFGRFWTIAAGRLVGFVWIQK